MSIISIDNKYCKILEEDDFDFLTKLDKHLSFKYVGVEFTPAYKSFRWDGIERLLSKKLEFYSGLFEYVLDFYKKHGKEYDVLDNRTPFSSNESLNLNLDIVPYDYQNNAVEECLKYDRLIYKHPTGSGKSITSAMITAKLGKSTAIYVISKDLLYQFHELFSKLFDQKIGIIGDGVCEIENISIVSIWTLGRAIGMKSNEIALAECDENEDYNENCSQRIIDYIKNVKIHQFDECHIVAAKTIRNIYKIINPEKIYGFSGTPVRDDGADLLVQGILGNNISEIKATELIDRRILAKPVIQFVYSKGKANFKDNYQTVYSENIINNITRNSIIANKTMTLIQKGYQVLVLFNNINHGNILFKLFKEKNINCDILNGKDSSDKRADIKNKLLNNELSCVLASRVYDIGIDIKTLSALVLAGGGKSSVKTLQRVGRVLRNGAEKECVAVVDFFDDCKFLKKHSLIRKSLYETEPGFEIIMPKEFKK